MTITNEFIEKAIKCKDANELYELANSEGVDLTLEKAKEYFSDELSDETLENVNGGACHGADGRLITTIANSCGKFKISHELMPDEREYGAKCKNCKYYSYNDPEYQKGERITTISAYCNYDRYGK